MQDGDRLDVQAHIGDCLRAVSTIPTTATPEGFHEKLRDAAEELAYVRSVFPDMWKGEVLGSFYKALIAARDDRGPRFDRAAAKLMVLEHFEPAAFAKQAAHPKPAEKPKPKPKIDLGAFDEGERPITPPPFLIRDILPLDGVTLLSGQSGAGKSFVAIDLAVALATCGQFFGKTPREPAAVLYVAAEGSATIQPRIDAAKWARHINGQIPIRVLTSVAFPTKPEEVETYNQAIAAELQAHRERWGLQQGVVFIDTASAAYTIKVENENAEIAALMKRNKALGAQLASPIVLLHHFGKDQERGARGASAWRDNADHQLTIMTDRKNNATGEVKVRNLYIEKHRFGREGPLAGFALGSVEMGVDEDGEAWSEAFVQVEEFKPIRKPEERNPQGAGRKPRADVDQKVHQAIVNSIIRSGDIRRAHGDGPPVRCIDIRTARAEFDRTAVTGFEDDEDKSKAAKTRRQWWGRAIPRLPADRFTTWKEGEMTYVAVINVTEEMPG